MKPADLDLHCFHKDNMVGRSDFFMYFLYGIHGKQYTLFFSKKGIFQESLKYFRDGNKK